MRNTGCTCTLARARAESSNLRQQVPTGVVDIQTAPTVVLAADREVNDGNGNRTRSSFGPMSKRANGQPPARLPTKAFDREGPEYGGRVQRVA